MLISMAWDLRRHVLKTSRSRFIKSNLCTTFTAWSVHSYLPQGLHLQELIILIVSLQKSIRMAYFDSLEASPDSEPEVPPQHVAHCLDVLRQDILCTGDDTPTPIHQHGHGQEDKKGEMRKCKDWGKLVEWTQGEERGSCFSMSGH